MGLNTVALIRNDKAASLERSPHALLHAFSYPPHGPDKGSMEYWRQCVDREADKHDEPHLDAEALIVLNSIHADGYRYFVQDDNCLAEYEYNWAGSRMRPDRMADGTKLTSIVPDDNGIVSAGRYSISLSCNDVLGELKDSMKTLAYAMANLPKQNDETYLRAWNNNLWNTARTFSETPLHENVLTVMNGGFPGETRYFRCGGNDIEEIRFHSKRGRRKDGKVPIVVSLFTHDFDKKRWKIQEFLKAQKKAKKLKPIAEAVGIKLWELQRYMQTGNFPTSQYSHHRQEEKLETYVQNALSAENSR